MKKLFLFIIGAVCTYALFAGNCISTRQVSVNYATKTVTFTLTWNGCDNVGHLNKAWTFIEFREVDNSGNYASGSSWTRATISVAPSVNNGTYAAGNTKGFYVTGTNGQSATVTAKLGNAPKKFNWCAFVTDQPPYVIADGTTYRLQGTPPFVLSASGGATQTVTGKTLPAANLQIAATTFTDATGCPGTFCPYTGSDLFRDATHLCGHRPGGAKNWEAYFKDARNNQIYRTVLMPDGNWWMADNLYYYTGLANGTHYVGGYGNIYYTMGVSVCPSNWGMPSSSHFVNLQNNYGGNYQNNLKATNGWSGSGYAGAGNDYYGISFKGTGSYTAYDGIDWSYMYYHVAFNVSDYSTYLNTCTTNPCIAVYYALGTIYYGYQIETLSGNVTRWASTFSPVFSTTRCIRVAM